MSREAIIENTTFIVNSFSGEGTTETLEELLARVIVQNAEHEQTLSIPSPKLLDYRRTKALSGKHLPGYLMYGYRQDPEDKHHWVVDDEAAEVVREIYRLCMDEFGSHQIETKKQRHILRKEKIHRFLDDLRTQKGLLIAFDECTFEQRLSESRFI